MLEKMLENAKFLDIAMRKIGARMQQEQVHKTILISFSLYCKFFTGNNVKSS